MHQVRYEDLKQLYWHFEELIYSSYYVNLPVQMICLFCPKDSVRLGKAQLIKGVLFVSPLSSWLI